MKMEHEQARPSNLQAYVFEYATGVLWTMVLILLALASQDAPRILRDASTTLTSFAALKFSDILTGFLIVVAGVVLPYALAMAFRPITISSMNGLLHLGRWIVPTQRNHQRRDLHLLAVRRVHETLGISSKPDYPELLAIITARNASAAETVEWLLNEATFRAASVLPSSLLLALITYRVSPAHKLFWALAVGSFVFMSGAAYAIQTLSRWRDRAEALVLLYTTSPITDNGSQVRLRTSNVAEPDTARS